MVRTHAHAAALESVRSIRARVVVSKHAHNPPRHPGPAPARPLPEDSGDRPRARTSSASTSSSTGTTSSRCPGDADGLHYEAWTELGSWAELTSRVEFGSLVNCNSYRNADLQADMARTLDNISDGRFIFGTGSGWKEKDYDEYGYEFGTAGTRLDALSESMARIEARWAKLNPAPVRKIPVLIGGGGEKKTLKIAAPVRRHLAQLHQPRRPASQAGDPCRARGIRRSRHQPDRDLERTARP